MNHSKARRKAERAAKFGNVGPAASERGREWDAMHPNAKGGAAGEQGLTEGGGELVGDKGKDASEG